MAFAAIHYAMNQWFDMDELFSSLIDSDSSSVWPSSLWSLGKSPRKSPTILTCACRLAPTDHSPAIHGISEVLHLVSHTTPLLEKTGLLCHGRVMTRAERGRKSICHSHVAVQLLVFRCLESL